MIAAKVAEVLGQPMPKTRRRQWVMVREFADAVPQARDHHIVAGQSSVDVTSREFLLTYAWRKLRMEVLIARGRRCECCGARPDDGVRIHVDHIKPRRLYPELAMVRSNLQILCEACNHGKGNWDETDWRLKEERLPDVYYRPMWSKPQ